MKENGKSRVELEAVLNGYPALKQVLQNIKQVVWVLDPITGQVLYVSPAFEIIWGCSCESFYNDQGSGIPPAEHKRVFKAFQRGAGMENSAVQGAGLGLAICKGLVEAHGGRIWIKNKNTPGATVSFTIPLVPEHTLARPVERER